MSENRMVPINSVSDYPNASFANNPKQAEQQRKQREKQEAVIKEGHVTVKKQNAFRRAKKKIVDEDGQNLKEYVVNDVLIPTVKNTIWDIITNGLDILLYGEARHGKQSGGAISKNGPYVRYQSISNPRPNNTGRVISPSGTSIRSALALDDFIFPTRAEANDILYRMCGIIDQYGNVTVADLYDLCNMRCPYTYNNYVWTDLSTAGVTLVRDGYLLNLPSPRALE